MKNIMNAQLDSEKKKQDKIKREELPALQKEIEQKIIKNFGDEKFCRKICDSIVRTGNARYQIDLKNSFDAIDHLDHEFIKNIPAVQNLQTQLAEAGISLDQDSTDIYDLREQLRYEMFGVMSLSMIVTFLPLIHTGLNFMADPGFFVVLKGLGMSAMTLIGPSVLIPMLSDSYNTASITFNLKAAEAKEAKYQGRNAVFLERYDEAVTDLTQYLGSFSKFDQKLKDLTSQIHTSMLLLKMQSVFDSEIKSVSHQVTGLTSLAKRYHELDTIRADEMSEVYRDLTESFDEVIDCLQQANQNSLEKLKMTLGNDAQAHSFVANLKLEDLSDEDRLALNSSDILNIAMRDLNKTPATSNQSGEQKRSLDL